MRALIHRRQIRQAGSEASGPGSTVGPLLRRVTAPLTWVGWLSLGGAAAMLILWAWGRVIGGVPSEPGLDLDLAGLSVLGQLASLATVLLPAALELGYPWVARRNPWLLRGTLLLALALLSRPLMSFVQDWAMNSLLPSDEGQLYESDVAFAVTQALALLAALLQALGWLGFLRGLVVAGGRPRNWVLVAFALAGVVVWVAALLPSFEQLWASDRALVSATNVLGILVSLCHAAATGGVVAALLVGAVKRLQPHLGWAFGSATALAMAVGTIAVPVQVLLGPSPQPDGSQGYWLPTVLTLLNIVSSLLLLVTCLAGIGRGTNERRVEWPRRRAYLVTGDRRLRPAGG